MEGRVRPSSRPYAAIIDDSDDHQALIHKPQPQKPKQHQSKKQQLQKHAQIQNQKQQSRKLRSLLYRMFVDTFVVGIGAVPSLYVSVGDMAVLAELDTRLETIRPQRRPKALTNGEEEGVPLDDL